MPIASSEYVSITSAVGGASATDARELKLRIYTSNELVATNDILDFSDSASVSEKFGSSSEEYLRSVYYFGFVSKNVESPATIQFARWANGDTSAQVFGYDTGDLDDLITYTSAEFDITLDGSTYSATGIDLSSASTYADVATAIQTVIQALGSPLDSATVTYNATDSRFEFNTNGTADGAISFTEVTDGFLDDMGWSSASVVFSAGVSAQTPAEIAASASEEDNDYGSFLFMDDLTIEQHTAVALWNDSENVKYMYLARCEKSDASDYYDALSGYSGTAVTLIDDVEDEYHDQFPGEIMATQDFDSANASQNYNFQTDSRRTAVITSTSEKTTYDALRMNYFGQTQEAGTLLEFYQPAQLMGGSSDPLAMGVYANEQWLKAELSAEALNMFIALAQVSADAAGLAIWTTYMQTIAEQAVDNGAISVGKTLTTTQQLYITQLSGDSTAYLDVASRGYWYTSEISSSTDDGVTTYSIDYTFIYAKRDSVDSISGSNVLI